MNRINQGFCILSLIAATFCLLSGCERLQAHADPCCTEPPGLHGLPQIPDGSDPDAAATQCDEGPNAS